MNPTKSIEAMPLPPMQPSGRKRRRRASNSLTASRRRTAELLIALFPLLAFAVYKFGVSALTVVLFSAASSVLFEILFELVLSRHWSASADDGSALLTGVLLGMVYPSAVSLWIPLFGSFAAIVIFGKLYGMLQKKVLFLPSLQAAASAALLLHLLFPAAMQDAGDPIVFLKNGALPEGMELSDLLLGNRAGALGCISAVLLALAALFLLARRRITWQTPAAFVGTVAALTFLFPNVGSGVMQGLLLNERFDFLCGEIFGGALLFAAVFLAADYAVSPLTTSGKLFSGILCGLLTVFIRYYTPAADGSFLAVSFIGLLHDLLDRLALLLRYPVGKNAKTRPSEDSGKNN